MVNTTDKTSAFTLLAVLTALILAAACAVLYLQWGASSGASQSVSGSAALSQALALHATGALGGDSEDFARLENDVMRLADLRRSAGAEALPGRADAWTNLEQQARAILASRGDTESISSAADAVAERMPELLNASDTLFELTGSSADIEEFQQRAIRLRQSLNGLSLNPDPQTAAAAISADLDYLRQVNNALSGEETELDIAALPAADRDTALAPLVAALADIEEATARALQAAANLDNPAATLDSVIDSANDIYAAAENEPAAATGETGFLAHPLLPLLLVGGALLLLAILAWMHSRTAHFERASQEQAEQNDRNQQAILR
ncbi:MAG TPA: hypothetical protein VF389_08740, partial [Woeseiaceae bacterium]